ncbi:putative DNA repair exonuclease SIA1 [Coleophoma cylindrospora]|uniref:Putative DNA repair exonuclease SIA1 n=1 Tax=Coleophoma cylindrospora TaxID=1849047 RepID=A0A3D8S7N3_9HELO|nr:putative DNA repair exonuclease SIA1 [Coleophoma cylindrospora]
MSRYIPDDRCALLLPRATWDQYIADHGPLYKDEKLPQRTGIRPNSSPASCRASVGRALFSFLMVASGFLLASFVLIRGLAAWPFGVQKRLNGTTAAPLRFTSEGTFQIAVFEDLHFGEAENTDWGPEQDVYSTKVMNTVLSIESPQLVVLNGDLITGENTFLSNSSSYVDQIVQPLVERGLSWASTYGNHDSDFNLSREAIFDRETSYANCLTNNMVVGDDAGVSNYYLPVFGKDVNSSVPALLIWFFDSRGGNYFQELDAEGNEVPQPNWVGQSVVDWFQTTKAELAQQYGTTIPSIAFVHIPVNAMAAFQTMGVNSQQEPGINDDNPLAQQGYAEGQGTVSGNVFTYSGQDIPFMSALLDTSGLLAVFSGHDHGDDWCFKWNTTLPGMNLTGNGLNLCFGRHSGYGGYGSWTRGSRQIFITEADLENSVVETWVTLEDSNISGKVSLNSTYGSDEYPVVADTDTGLP